MDISTEPFLEEQNFLTEKATAQILACPSVLSSFLASARVEVRLCAGSTVLASACLVLAPVLHLAPQGEASYLTSLPLLAPHSLPTHGQGQPSLTVSDSLKKVAELSTSAGHLSPSPEPESRAPSPPTRLPREEPSNMP